MYKSFDEQKFNKAITDKNYSYIKICIINAIRNNPNFKPNVEHKCEAQMAFSQVCQVCPDILEHYQLQEGETEFNEKDRAKWDKEYFIRQTFLLKKNFCKERYENIKKIGQAITENFPNPQGQTTNPVSNTHTKSLVTVNLMLVALLMLVVLVVIVMAKNRN